MLVPILLSNILISLVSFVGVFFIGKKINSQNFLNYIVVFAASTMFFTAIFNVLPEAIHEMGINYFLTVSLILVIILVVFDKLIYKKVYLSTNIKNYAFFNLFSDAIHNFLDGVVLTASYLVSLQAGISTTIATIMHEVPQEVGDLGVLLKGGLKLKKALILNFIIALTSILGSLVAFYFARLTESFHFLLLPIAFAFLTYVPLFDLLPEVKTTNKKVIINYLFICLLSFLIIYLTTTLVPHNH